MEETGDTSEAAPVATLNIKNLPESLYRKLKARAKRQRRSVAQEVTQMLSELLEQAEPTSIQALRGLGKEYWREDASAHVRRERESWE
jgi:plasmid stability protein